jgi:hypothetical protein
VRPGGARQPTVRVAPVKLAASAQVRLRRLAPGATYREDTAQLLLPLTNGASAPDAVRTVIEELIPAGDVRTGGDTL